MNLGAISYNVELSTAEMLKGEALINKSIAGIVKDFDKADSAVREFEKTQKQLGRTINSMGQVLNANGKVVVNASQQYRNLANSANEAFGKLNTQATGTAQAVNRAFTSNLGQAGIQVQQFVGQIQGGQSAMVALAQQSADLGIVLGAPLIGVFVSLAAVAAGTLAPALFDSVTNMEKLEKAIEQVKAVMTVGADGVANYTDELKKLNAISETIAKAKLAAAIKTQEDAIRSGFKAASEALESFGTVFSNTNFTIAKETGFSAKAINDLDQALRLRNADEVESALGMLSSELDKSTKKGRKFFDQITDIAAKLITAKSDLDAMNKEVKETGSTASKTNKDVKDLVEALLLEREELVNGKSAALDLKLTMEGFKESQRKAIVAIYETNIALDEQKEKAKEDAKAIKKVGDELDLFFDRESQQSTRKDRQQTAKLTKQVETIGLTPIEEIQARHDAELELLRQAEEKGIEIRGTYAERQKELEKQKNEAIQSEYRNSLGFLGDALGNFEQQSAAALTSVVTGAQSGSDALKGLARTILTSVIQAIIQQGIAAATASATAAAAQSAANTTIAATAAPAAAAVSLATLGANAAPASAGIASTAAIAASLLGVGALAGGREFGGPVSAGSRYRVGEKGKPEFYKDNLTGNLSMIPGENGEVIPADKMGMGSITVNVNNHTPSQVYVTKDEAQGIVSIAIGQADKKRQKGMAKGTGQEARILQSTTNVRSRAT